MSYDRDYNKVYKIVKQEVLDALRIITDYISDQIADEVSERLLDARENAGKTKARDIERGDFITIKSVHFTNPNRRRFKVGDVLQVLHCYDRVFKVKCPYGARYGHVYFEDYDFEKKTD